MVKWVAGRVGQIFGLYGLAGNRELGALERVTQFGGTLWGYIILTYILSWLGMLIGSWDLLLMGYL